MCFITEIYLGTIALEVNRHRKGKIPSYRISEWDDRICKAGFDGIELWENHALLCSDQEFGLLFGLHSSIAIFNSYVSLLQDGQQMRKRIYRVATDLQARSLKFNLGNHHKQLDQG